MKEKYVIELQGDYYSLSYFAFYLDSDDEDLSEIKNYYQVKENLEIQR